MEIKNTRENIKEEIRKLDSVKKFYYFDNVKRLILLKCSKILIDLIFKNKRYFLSLNDYNTKKNSLYSTTKLFECKIFVEKLGYLNFNEITKINHLRLEENVSEFSSILDCENDLQKQECFFLQSSEIIGNEKLHLLLTLLISCLNIRGSLFHYKTHRDFSWVAFGDIPESDSNINVLFLQKWIFKDGTTLDETFEEFQAEVCNSKYYRKPFAYELKQNKLWNKPSQEKEKVFDITLNSNQQNIFKNLRKMKKVKTNKLQVFCINASAGTGKTTFAHYLRSKYSTLYLASSNQVVNEGPKPSCSIAKFLMGAFRVNLVDLIHMLEDTDMEEYDNCVMDLFGNRSPYMKVDSIINLLGSQMLDFVLIDEFSMVSCIEIRLIICLFHYFKDIFNYPVIILLGDPNQFQKINVDHFSNIRNIFRLCKKIFYLYKNVRCKDFQLYKRICKLESGEEILNMRNDSIIRKNDIINTKDKCLKDFIFLNVKNETLYKNSMAVIWKFRASLDELFFFQRLKEYDDQYIIDYSTKSCLPLILNSEYRLIKEIQFDRKSITLFKKTKLKLIEFDGDRLHFLIEENGMEFKLAPSIYQDYTLQKYYGFPIELYNWSTSYSIQGCTLDQKIYIDAKECNPVSLYVNISRAQRRNQIQIINCK